MEETGKMPVLQEHRHPGSEKNRQGCRRYRNTAILAVKETGKMPAVQEHRHPGGERNRQGCRWYRNTAILAVEKTGRDAGGTGTPPSWRWKKPAGMPAVQTEKP